MNGSASVPSSATINGTRCAISEATNAASREIELGTAIERIGTLAGFDLSELGGDGESLWLRQVTAVR
jgi:hypothetical protein